MQASSAPGPSFPSEESGDLDLNLGPGPREQRRPLCSVGPPGGLEQPGRLPGLIKKQETAGAQP